MQAALSDRAIDVLAVRADVIAHPFDMKPVAPDRNGSVGRRPRHRYRHPASSLAALTTGLGQAAFTAPTPAGTTTSPS